MLAIIFNVWGQWALTGQEVHKLFLALILCEPIQTQKDKYPGSLSFVDIVGEGQGVDWSLRHGLTLKSWLALELDTFEFIDICLPIAGIKSP